MSVRLRGCEKAGNETGRDMEIGDRRTSPLSASAISSSCSVIGFYDVDRFGDGEIRRRQAEKD